MIYYENQKFLKKFVGNEYFSLKNIDIIIISFLKNINHLSNHMKRYILTT